MPLQHRRPSLTQNVDVHKLAELGQRVKIIIRYLTAAWQCRKGKSLVFLFAAASQKMRGVCGVPYAV